jgi:hypothetical protein
MWRGLALACVLLGPMMLATHRAAAAPAAQQPVSPAPAVSAPPPPPPPSPPPPLLPRIDPSTVPDACKSLAQQAVAPSVPAALSARISLASCMADRAIAPLALCDCAASILEVDAAVAPAMTVLDDVIAAGDPMAELLAEHARGQLHASFLTRLRATLPHLAPGASDAEVTLRDLRRANLEAQLGPWREAAATAFQRVGETAGAHPELAGNPAVATAVRDSQQQLAAGAPAR